MKSTRFPIGPAFGPAAAFTLVEVITALLIFSVAVLGLIEGIGSSIRHQSDLLDRQRAAMIAENIMEEIAYTRDLETGENEGNQEGEDERFTWRTNIEETDDEGLMAVSIEVSWGEGGAGGRYTLSTLLLEDGDSVMAPSETSGGVENSTPGQAPQPGGMR